MGDRSGPHTRNRRDVDDAARPLSLHGDSGGAHSEEYAGLVDRGHLIPQLHRGLGQADRAEDPGIVHEHVQPPVALDHGVHDALPIGFAGDVMFECLDSVAQRFCGLMHLREHVGDHHARTGGREHGGLGRALTSSASGDECDLAVESIHVSPRSGFVLHTATVDDDRWEDHSNWWQDEFTDGADAEYEEQILPLARQLMSGARRVLDVGTGEGQIARLLRREGADVVGIDPTHNQIVEANKRGGGVAYARAGAAELPFSTGAFDGAIACAGWAGCFRLADVVWRGRKLVRQT